GPADGSADLLLAGDRALVLSRDGGYSVAALPAGGGAPVMPVDGSPAGGATLVQVDLAGRPRGTGPLTVDGRDVDARLVGSTARVVVSSAPRLQFPYQPGGTDRQRITANQRIIDRTGLDGWLPHYTLVRDGRTSTGRVDCAAARTPDSFSGAAMLTVLT